MLRGQGWRTSIGLISNTLFWMVLALSVLTVWMLLGTWRHMRRRSQIQDALVQETNFRRAMENSMPTGMRAMDLDGRITYVNAAFCQMTGFAQGELVGRLPPYPYWPPDRIDENSRLLQQELQGRSPSGGIEVKVMRKDGTLFDARMYVSPLIDPKAQQTGLDDQHDQHHRGQAHPRPALGQPRALHHRARGPGRRRSRCCRCSRASCCSPTAPTGCGSAAMPAAISRWPAAWSARPTSADADDDFDPLSGLPTHELTETGANPREVFVESLQKWFDVRARYLQWTDGRLAQMLIATDITARLRAEEQSAAQAEKAQVTSRLVTMGEMASSVAHELNQPLTAITNYCNGMVSRVRAETIARDDLVAALQKTARQAERAGQIIRRIRAFVKRSEPQRQPSQARQIIDDAVELAGIELRRRNVAIHTYVAQRLPPILVRPDPDRAGGAEPAEERGRGHRRRAAAAGAPPHRVARRAAPHAGGRRRHRVQRHRHGPRHQGRGHRRLYEAFFTTKAEGLGIGLSLCRTIIESHRGRMRAQNLYNGDGVVGCRFSFTLPVELPAGPHRKPTPTPPLASLEAASVTQPHRDPRMSLIPKKGTVYVVDDDEAVRDSLQWLLEGKDYRVKCFDSSESFLSRFDPREVACLIADIRMEGMSGLELQDRLLERKSPLPVVFITGHGDVPMAVTTMKKGAMDFIEKPFKEEELLGLVERMLEQARAGLQPAPGAGQPRRPAVAPDDARGAGARAHRRRAPEQADRRRPGHQHQDGGGAPRQHHGKAERQHGGGLAQDRAGSATGLTAVPARPLAQALNAQLPEPPPRAGSSQVDEGHTGHDGATHRRRCPVAADPRRGGATRRGADRARPPARAGGDPGRRRPGQRGLRAQQGQGLPRARPALGARALRRHAGARPSCWRASRR